MQAALALLMFSVLCAGSVHHAALGMHMTAEPCPSRRLEMPCAAHGILMWVLAMYHIALAAILWPVQCSGMMPLYNCLHATHSITQGALLP